MERRSVSFNSSQISVISSISSSVRCSNAAGSTDVFSVVSSSDFYFSPLSMLSKIIRRIESTKYNPLNTLDIAFPLIMWLTTFFPLYTCTSSFSKPEPSIHIYLPYIPILPLKLIKQWKSPKLTMIFSFFVSNISVALTHNGWSNVIQGVAILE